MIIALRQCFDSRHQQKSFHRQEKNIDIFKYWGLPLFCLIQSTFHIRNTHTSPQIGADNLSWMFQLYRPLTSEWRAVSSTSLRYRRSPTCWPPASRRTSQRSKFRYILTNLWKVYFRILKSRLCVQFFCNLTFSAKFFMSI